MHKGPLEPTASGCIVRAAAVARVQYATALPVLFPPPADLRPRTSSLQGVPSVSRAAAVTGIQDAAFLEALAAAAVRAMPELSAADICSIVESFSGEGSNRGKQPSVVGCTSWQGSAPQLSAADICSIVWSLSGGVGGGFRVFDTSQVGNVVVRTSWQQHVDEGAPMHTPLTLQTWTADLDCYSIEFKDATADLVLARCACACACAGAQHRAAATPPSPAAAAAVAAGVSGKRTARIVAHTPAWVLCRLLEVRGDLRGHLLRAFPACPALHLTACAPCLSGPQAGRVFRGHAGPPAARFWRHELLRRRAAGGGGLGGSFGLAQQDRELRHEAGR